MTEEGKKDNFNLLLPPDFINLLKIRSGSNWKKVELRNSTFLNIREKYFHCGFETILN